MRWITVTWSEDCFEGEFTRNSKNKQQKRLLLTEIAIKRSKLRDVQHQSYIRMVVKVVLTFILHLRHWDWWGMFIPLQVIYFVATIPYLLLSLPIFFVLRPYVQFLSSIIHQSLPCLTLLCGPSIHVFSPHAGPKPDSKQVFFASKEVSRGSYTVWCEQMLVLFNTVNTPKGQASLTHTETYWKTHNQTWLTLCRKSLFLPSFSLPFLMSVWIFDWTTIINPKGNCSIASKQITLNWYSWSKKCTNDLFLHLEKHMSDLFGLMKMGVFKIQRSNSPWEYH